MSTESCMNDEYTRPSDSHVSYRMLAQRIPRAVSDKIKEDWMTGQFNTVQLAEKYKVPRGKIIARMRFDWMTEAKRLGTVWAKEPPYEPKRYGDAVWEMARLDFLAGKTLDEISAKHGIDRNYLYYKKNKMGWTKERRQMFAESHASIQGVVNSRAGEIAAKYEGFVNVAIEQIDVMTEKLKVMAAEGTCTPERLKTMVDTLGGLVTNMMKVCGVEKSTTQVQNNQFIRLDVMDSSSAATMNQLAKTIDLKSA